MKLKTVSLCLKRMLLSNIEKNNCKREFDPSLKEFNCSQFEDNEKMAIDMVNFNIFINRYIFISKHFK